MLACLALFDVHRASLSCLIYEHACAAAAAVSATTSEARVLRAAPIETSGEITSRVLAYNFLDTFFNARSEDCRRL